MNASVAFYSPQQQNSAQHAEPAKPVVVVPAGAVRDNSVFVVSDGRAVKKAVKVAGTTSQGVRIDSGLIGGEDLISNPPPDLKDGQKVRPKRG
jgi:HlyD family secretion protein